MPEPPNLTPQELGKYMLENHGGPSRAKPNRVIAPKLGFRDLGTNGRDGLPNSAQFTALADQCVGLGIPVVSGHRGYYYALNRSEFDHYINHCKKMALDWDRKWREAIAASSKVYNDFLEFENE